MSNIKIKLNIHPSIKQTIDKCFQINGFYYNKEDAQLIIKTSRENPKYTPPSTADVKHLLEISGLSK